MNASPVDRTAPDARAAALDAAVAPLTDGHLALVAPEGRISGSLELLPHSVGSSAHGVGSRGSGRTERGLGNAALLNAGRRLDMRPALGLPVNGVFAPLMNVLDDDPADFTARLQDLSGRSWIPSSASAPAAPQRARRGCPAVRRLSPPSLHNR